MRKGFLCILLALIIAITLIPSVIAAENRGTAVFIYQPVENAIGEGDQALINHLESMGFTVKPVIDSECVTASADGAALLVIVESCSSANVKEKFAKIETPIFCCEMAAWEDLGMGTQIGAADGVHSLTFNGKSEIETALSKKSFDVFTQSSTMVLMDPKTVSADAVLIGENADGNTPVVTYEKGAALIDGSGATSRRASGFIFGQTAAFFTPQAWELMTAVVNWLSPVPVVETEPVTAAEQTAEPAAAEPVEAAAQTSDTMFNAVLLSVTAITGLIVISLKKKV